MAKAFASVLIDTYNHERFIEQAIVSVLEQDFPAADREVLVVDDGSTDRTPEIVRKFAPQVRLLRKANGGQASAFNAGIPECKGEMVAFLDGDDWWAPGKLSVVAGEFENHPAIGTLGHGIYEVEENGAPQAVISPKKTCDLHLRDTSQGSLFLSLRAFLGTSRLAVRTKVLRQALPLPLGLVIEADEFLSTLTTALGGSRILEQPLTHYRYHSGNLFQFSEWNPGKVRRKYDSLACFLRELPSRLRNAGVAEGVISVVIDAVRIDAERLRLSLGEGWPWETVRVEREAYRQAYRGATMGYHLFHGAVLGLAGILPPAIFYRLRNWYAQKGLAKAREVVGSADSALSFVVHKVRSS